MPFRNTTADYYNYPLQKRHSTENVVQSRGRLAGVRRVFLGMLPAVLQDTYGHHHPDHLQGAAATIGRKTRGPAPRAGLGSSTPETTVLAPPHRVLVL